ncbi:hypothetical protein SLEP1_g40806 [Rubroshorea leprosula]|uniref:HMA domain-containing protein n=1 Tax=Rubroshorea leprosula TaxID=152421 RepID=A0AAV5L5G0_9ROSI|nr:hypothetical protein SLEP1_g40806 [Rubroshorea leprosula]
MGQLNQEENKEQEKKKEEKKGEKKEEKLPDIVYRVAMKCEKCCSKVRKIIAGQDGVAAVAFNRESGTVEVQVDAAAREGLRKRRGKNVAPISPVPEPPEQKKEENKEQREPKKEEPLYALVAMTLSLLAFALCVSELLYNGLKDDITFRRPPGKIPWFYYPPRSENSERFGTFADLIGLVSAISQCIVTAINYDSARRAANSPIKFSLLPIIFAFGLLCSKIVETAEKRASGRKGLQTEKSVEDRV